MSSSSSLSEWESSLVDSLKSPEDLFRSERRSGLRPVTRRTINLPDRKRSIEISDSDDDLPIAEAKRIKITVKKEQQKQNPVLSNIQANPSKSIAKEIKDLEKQLNDHELRLEKALKNLKTQRKSLTAMKKQMGGAGSIFEKSEAEELTLRFLKRILAQSGCENGVADQNSGV